MQLPVDAARFNRLLPPIGARATTFQVCARCPEQSLIPAIWVTALQVCAARSASSCIVKKVNDFLGITRLQECSLKSCKMESYRHGGYSSVAERQTVALDVVGSTPTTHPKPSSLTH